MTYENALEEYFNEDENGKHKLVYVYFGLSVYKSQCLEETFSNMRFPSRARLRLEISREASSR